MSKSTTAKAAAATTVRHRPIVKGDQDTAFLVASSFADKMLSTLHGETLSEQGVNIICDFIRARLGGNAEV